ncbi:hypothetical protein [Anaplasma ovis]|uniref:hypothetical protein n=1 Tax=Anaplasma ovis TaxID=142058 RepID=UPI00094762E8|nr:hypothetical protein [Anaplasma ovis]
MFFIFNMQPVLLGELSAKLPGQLWRKLASVRFRTSFRGASVLEFFPHSVEFEDIMSPIKEYYKGVLEFSEGAL